MPIYEYVCEACGEQTEIIHGISEPPVRKCPNCGKNKLVKLVSAAAFRLKGGGWYETDFKSDSDRKRNLVSDKEPAAGDSDKKPAAAKPKAEAKPAKAAKAKPAAKPAKKGGKTK